MNSPTIKRKAFSSFSVIVVFFALVIIGIAFIPTLDIRYQQSRTSPLLRVSYSWPNASPKVIENETSKIEGILGKIGQVESVESISGIGYGYVTLRFDKHANMDEKRYEVSMLLRQLRSKLPEGMSYPVIYANIDDDEESSQLFMVLTLVGNASTYYIQKLAEQEVKPSLLKVSGIDAIDIGGSTPIQWEITFDPELMKSLSISPSEISSAINELGNKEFLGTHKDASGFTIPVLSSTQNVPPENWGSLVIANKKGRVIKLSDVANIRLKDKPPSTYYRINGKNNITLRLSSASGVNQVKLSQQIYEQLESIRGELPNGYSLLVSTDTSTYIKEELTKIGLRTLFSLIILLLFVLVVSRSWRILLILTISLVSNLLIACVFYYIFKVEIHIYSLAA
ncbi:MAG TPA: efflux RND transporter permease subunit, partial [Draconibacterium sp.]|nr:efflux RND transporter permease subunit [Draconibacterium sp.]